MLAVRCAWQAGKVLAPLSRGRIARARARNTRMVDLESVVLAAEAGRARWLLLQGFRIRCPQWVARQAPGLRAFFTPIDVHRQPAEALIAAQRQVPRSSSACISVTEIMPSMSAGGTSIPCRNTRI
jgi:hypothetical protein